MEGGIELEYVIIETKRLEGKMDRADRRFISGFDADISGTVFS